MHAKCTLKSANASGAEAIKTSMMPTIALTYISVAPDHAQSASIVCASRVSATHTVRRIELIYLAVQTCSDE
jgi:hypothetical protein